MWQRQYLTAPSLDPHAAHPQLCFANLHAFGPEQPPFSMVTRHLFWVATTYHYMLYSALMKSGH